MRFDRHTPAVEYECPFCKGRFYVIYDEKGPSGIGHLVPTCTKYDESEEPHEFLRAVNVRLGAHN